ncbi:unnamed protein product [Caenorhabditis auriculariae]|uniref:Uncharacterized protein n=1 Tax=Caenorhabditis auriculariae TaxID=2777116 RepID=A0A8S1GN43_9PELO|nr:unnamed protein product [Caenorhabditis auriculariae]
MTAKRDRLKKGCRKVDDPQGVAELHVRKTYTHTYTQNAATVVRRSINQFPVRDLRKNAQTCRLTGHLLPLRIVGTPVAVSTRPGISPRTAYRTFASGVLTEPSFGFDNLDCGIITCKPSIRSCLRDCLCVYRQLNCRRAAPSWQQHARNVVRPSVAVDRRKGPYRNVDTSHYSDSAIILRRCLEAAEAPPQEEPRRSNRIPIECVLNSDASHVQTANKHIITTLQHGKPQPFLLSLRLDPIRR